MKKYICLVFIYLFCTSFSFAKSPDIFFQYSPLFEKLCPAESSKLITEEHKNFATSFVSEAGSIYREETLSFFSFLAKEFPGPGFSRKELTATLTLCKEFGSFSMPLTVNIFRGAAHKIKNPKSQLYKIMFSETLFHELIHTWQLENFNYGNLKFLMKYASEPVRVKSHLYLLALEEYVFRELNRPKLLKRIQWLYPNMGSGDYKRAWEIVQKEGHKAFINDLKNNLQ